MKRYATWVLLLLPAIAFCANQSDLEKLIQLKKTATPLSLDLSNADLRDYPFVPGKIDLHLANLSHSNLSGVSLSKMNLDGADLSYADLSNAKLNQASLIGADLSHANLAGAELQQSNLSGANLTAATLTAANLQQAIFSKADLTCANLNQADLSQSSFAEADISGATFVNTITNDIRGYDSVTDRKVECEVQSPA